MYVKTTEFTFHYGSILIVQESHAWREITRFTFHYGSILIAIAKQRIRIVMIYIPLWFYSNLIMFYRNRNSYIYLHSTMVLF